MSNVSKGRTSKDSTVGDTLIPFFNRNVTPYPTEAGSVNFAPVPVTQQKDHMINVARLHAQQEYDRIMELVEVLQRQAQQIKRRLEITDWVHSARYDFQLSHGQIYWLVQDTRKQELILSGMAPDQWSAGKPEWYEYRACVRWLGDHTWIEVDLDQ